ncbi:MAG: primosomal protein N' [Phycisphaerales bacterium]
MSDASLFAHDDETPGGALGEREVYARIAVERAIEGEAGEGLLYRGEGLRVGDRVEAPLGRGNKTAGGIVVAVGGDELLAGFDPRRVKTARGTGRGRLPAPLVELARWISSYYICPLGTVLATMTPAAVKAGTGRRTRVCVEPTERSEESADVTGLTPSVQAALAEIRKLTPGVFPVEARELARLIGAKNAGPINKLVAGGYLREVEVRTVRAPEAFWESRRVEAATPGAIELTDAQAGAIEGVGASLGDFRVHLLRGVTGSGKTEVYLRVIERALTSGKSALVLVPEISLTPQTAGRFIERFSSHGVAVLHSGLTAASRHKQWAAAASGDARVVVGVRSAVFAPLADLGVIIVDEEHDASYKQDQAPRYHARDVAIKRAQVEGCPVVLGSATPSLESWRNAWGGRYALWELPERVGGGALPRVQIVDLGEERKLRRDLEGRDPHVLDAIGPTLERAIEITIRGGAQVILLQNRRGYAGYVACPDSRCGWRLECTECDATMVVHRAGARKGYVRCHHCLAQQVRPEVCPVCNKRLIDLSVGTQRVEEELERRFGTTLGLIRGETMERVDSDTMRHARAYFDVLERFSRGELKLLLGTQMIAKGLDYPGVRLVGVINADTALGLADFRASERTFQLISQVAGRAGRGVEPGLVVVQTFARAEPALRYAAAHDAPGFAEQELETRVRAALPPATRMARVVVRDESLDKAEDLATRIATALIEHAERGVCVNGPWPCPIARVAGRHRIGIEVVAADAGTLRRTLGAARAAGLLTSDHQVAVDVDPVALL